MPTSQPDLPPLSHMSANEPGFIADPQPGPPAPKSGGEALGAINPGSNLADVRPTVLLAFGAHPDDIEFGCGAVIALETRAGRPAHLVVCSRGEAGTYGSPEVRTAESHTAAAIIGATLEFLDLDGDAHLEIRASHAVLLAAVLRRVRPAIVLAPSLVPNQHPDHWRLGQLVRDAARLARYGGVHELAERPPHAIDGLYFYAGSLQTEPPARPILVDVSAPEVIAAWTAAMEAHASQTSARSYVEMQINRARLHGLSAGVDYAIALFPNDPVVVQSLGGVSRGARQF
ncbi:MAG: PIG-L family deacetylase [Armatimonadota bacterium]|nr:PIG-L family deacetylase [Armatimonadota bacterium]